MIAEQQTIKLLNIQKRGQDMDTWERYREAGRLKEKEIERLKRFLDVKQNHLKW